MAKLHFQIVTPERAVNAGEADSITCPTSEGFITILPNHVPLVGNLVSGEMVVRTGGQDDIYHIAGGCVQIKPGNEVVFLADQSEHISEIDLERAEQAKQAAEEALREQAMSDEEYAMTSALLQRNLSRIHIARKHAHRRTRITSEGVFHSND